MHSLVVFGDMFFNIYFLTYRFLPRPYLSVLLLASVSMNNFGSFGNFGNLPIQHHSRNRSTPSNERSNHQLQAAAAQRLLPDELRLPIPQAAVTRLAF